MFKTVPGTELTKYCTDVGLAGLVVMQINLIRTDNASFLSYREHVTVHIRKPQSCTFHYASYYHRA